MNMTKIAIALVGDHGGELDRETVELREDGDHSAAIGRAIARMLNDWCVNPGDTIRIIALED
jgi:hypothetical protein